MLRSVVACATLLFSLPALAAIYESPVVIDDEDDLRSAAERGEISDATLQTLVELLQDGVDLNKASRDELYELPGLTYADVDAIVQYRRNEGHIDDPAALVGAGALTADQLEQIAPFIIISPPEVKIPFGGYYRLLGNYTVGDPLAPPWFLKARVKGPFSLTGGIGVTFNRRRPGAPTYDDTRRTRDSNSHLGALTVTAPRYSLELPKFWVQWKSTKFRVLAGTYRIGFGQRLTLDNTTRYTPKGITPDDVFYVNRELTTLCRYTRGELPMGEEPCPYDPDLRGTDDFRWRDPFRGVAVSAEDLEIGETARASFYAFGSYQTRSIYMYEMYSRTLCDDPRNDDADTCKSPNVFVDLGDGALDRRKLAYTTLPNVWNELIGGAHAQISPIPMFEIGITGYGAMPFWNVNIPGELQLDFQEYNKYPFGGPWGAVGLDARVTAGAWNLFLEAARSFDNIPGGGGGWGVVQRSVWGKKKRELEITARFYDVRYVNPYARPVSSPDEVDGQRARDEAGLRVKYTDRTLGDFAVRGWVDFWALPWDQRGLEGEITGATGGGYRAGTMNLQALVRADYKGWTVFEPSLWLDYRNKDLTNLNGDPTDPQVGRCYTSLDGRAPPLIDGDPQLCLGERYRVGTRLYFRPIPKKLELAVTYQHDLVSDIDYTDRLSQDLRLTFEARSRPVDQLLFRLRSRYLKQDIFSNNRLEESLWSFLEVSWLGFRVFHATVRYDVYLWLDKRQGTLDRLPNPEHRIRLELEGRF